jgi:hypothetical protein
MRNTSDKQAAMSLVCTGILWAAVLARPTLFGGMNGVIGASVIMVCVSALALSLVYCILGLFGNGREPRGEITSLAAIASVGSLILFVVLAWPRPPDTSGNEANAISALRTISYSQEIYDTRYGGYGTFEDLHRKNLIDSVLADAYAEGTSPKYGYYYAMTVNDPDSWCCVAFPAIWAWTGDFKYRITEDGILYKSTDDSTNEFPDGGTQLGR